MTIMTAVLLFLLPCAAPAQAPSDPATGYVVRLVDAGTVVLDFNEKSGAAVGQPFTIFKEGAELKHPVTGKPLGKMEDKIAEGSLKEILPLYSIGTLSVKDVVQPITPGLRARLKAAAAPAPAQTPSPTAVQVAQVAQALGMTAKREPLGRGPALDYEGKAMAIADCDGKGGRQAAISDGRSVFLYPFPLQDAKPLAQFDLAGTAPRILSLEAADLNGNGRAEVFVALLNDTMNRFETAVLELDGQGRLVKVGELPYLVRGYQDQEGKRLLAAQQITEDHSFPFGAIYPLQYQDGKYGPSKPALRFAKRRPDWIYDFDFLALDGKANTVTVTNTELVRVEFPSGKTWKSPESYCQTPNRVRWSGDRMLHFRPQFLARYDGGAPGLYLIKNIAALGGLAGSFGIFARSELHRQDWNGVSLAPAWVAELGGYSTGLVRVEPAGGTPVLAVLVVGTGGRSSVWTFAP